jgi:pyruvate/2-oxoglutarate dehydrogenase complex dihydrolipoamide acyltransferase (E2) component
VDPADARRVRVTVPVLGDGLSSATVLTLLRASGCAVQRDQVIAELEIDKAILQVESPVDGMLASWFVKPGQHVDLHEPLAEI